MKRLILLISLLVVFAAFPALAQEGAAHTVAFDDFSFTFPASLASGVAVNTFPGDPPTLEQPGGPDPRHTQFVLYNAAPAPETFYDGAGGVRVYRIADFAGYAQVEPQLSRLQTLLAQRPDLAQYMMGDTTGDVSLPFLPVAPAAQVIRARAHFVDTPSVQGISYVTVYRQDVSPFVAAEFRYVFQGISTDGMTYISANFPLSTGLFPAEIPADFDMEGFSQQFETYLSDSIATLNNAAPEDFTPSLTTLDTIIQSFTLTTAPTAPATPLPEVTPTATAVTDPTMGGLAGATWRLVSYGSQDDPQPASEAVPATIVFDISGVSGNAGCNNFGGSFQYANNTLTFGNVITTLMACADQGIMDQELAFLAALQTVTAYQIDGDQLQIFYDGGVLTFTSGAGEPEATVVTSPTWRLVAYGSADDPQLPLDDTPITLVFDTAGGLYGHAGCNSYNGSYTAAYPQAAQGSVTVSPLVTTRIACAPPIMDQENAYLGALQSATSFTAVDDQLQIFYDGGVLTFTSAL